jgi:Tfp pilus assembly protein PilO
MRRRFPKPRLAIATLVGLLAVLAGGYAFVLGPQRQKLQALGTQIEDAQAQLAAAQAPPAANPDQAPIRVADLFRLSRAMPDKADLPDVLLQLSQIATETGITFTSITPGDPVVLGDYQRIPIDLVFQGHFYDLSDFLYRLRNLVGVHDGELDATGRLFSVESVTFAEGEATLRVDAYIFGDGTDAAPAADATATPAPTESTPASTTAATTTAAPGPLPIPSVPLGQGAAAGAGS